jgi:hypothetical protein
MHGRETLQIRNQTDQGRCRNKHAASVMIHLELCPSKADATLPAKVSHQEAYFVFFRF